MKYLKHKISSLLDIKNFFTIRDIKIKKGFETKSESHNFWEFLYIKTGRLLIFFGDRTVTLSSGEIIFHKPGEKHSFGCLSDESRVFIMTFDCASPAVSRFENFHSEVPSGLQPLMAQIIQEANGTFAVNEYTQPPDVPVLDTLPCPNLGGEQVLKNMLEIFLIAYLREQNDASKNTARFLAEKDFETNIVETVKAYLRKNIHGKVRIDDVCEYLGYGKTTVSSIFKKHTGEGIITYYIDQKMSLAKELLVTTAMPVAEISDTLNFYGPKHFSKLFKDRAGISPAEYRRLYKEEARLKSGNTKNA